VSSLATPYRLLATRLSPTVLLDAALAVAALAGAIVLVMHSGVPVSQRDAVDLDIAGLVLMACATVPLAAWRRSPSGVFALTATASALLEALGHPIGFALGPATALFLLAASRDESRPWTARNTTAVVGLFVAYLATTAAAAATFPTSELLHTGLAWAVAWFAGERSRLRRAHVSQLEERVARTERDSERERLLAAAEERARIARDLHDSAGHAVNVIAVRAGAARLRHQEDPDRSLLALEAIEELARQTAGDIEQIVGSLRDSNAPHGFVEAPPGLASLHTLIAQRSASGLDVTLHTGGAPRPLGAPVDQAAYRILQEALTNAARHGAGSARIEIEYRTRDFEVAVTNPIRTDTSSRSSGGRGLVGMRERTTLLGGRLDAQRANGEFVLRAQLPYGGQQA
jgi:signal transduction histidine kinase